MSKPSFYGPLLRRIGEMPIPGTTSWREGSSEEWTITYVPVPGNDLKDLVLDISGEVLAEIAGIVATDLDVRAFLGRGVVGIWDRESPGTPFHRFAEDQLPGAMETYEQLRRDPAQDRPANTK